MAHEVDGEGNVRVFTFTVTYHNGKMRQTTCEGFTDVAVGWDWARARVSDFRDLDAKNRADISWDDAWVPEAEVDEYIAHVPKNKIEFIKAQSEVRRTPIKDPHRLNVLLDGETMTRLKKRALELDTTAAEIIRDLIERYLDRP